MSAMTRPTANGVSRTLGRKTKRSQSHGTRVRGITDVTPGFKVWTEPNGKGYVVVEHKTGRGPFNRDRTIVGREDHDAAMAEALERYAAILTDAGYTVVTAEPLALIVTGRVDA